MQVREYRFKMSVTRITQLFITLCAMSLLSYAEPLSVGSNAPAITATTETGDSLSFADVYKKGFTLVYFFPKADTPGCTAQGCSLRDSYEQLTQKGITVIGVSTDKVEDQKAFKEKYHFPFTLIADTDKKVMHAFGQDGIMFASRQAFLVNRDGKVVWRDLKASTKQQAADVLAAIKQLSD